MSLRLLAPAILIALTLAGCARLETDAPRWLRAEPAPAAPPSANARPAEVPAPRPKATAAKPAAVPAPVPVPVPIKLVGLSEAETEGLLGRPAEETDRPPGKVWIYQGPNCRLTVHLFPDMEKGGFYALDYTVEDGSREACLGKVAGEVRKRG